MKKNAKPKFVPLSSKEIDPVTFKGQDGFNYAPWFKWRIATEEDRWSWYQRVFVNVRYP